MASWQTLYVTRPVSSKLSRSLPAGPRFEPCNLVSLTSTTRDVHFPYMVKFRLGLGPGLMLIKLITGPNKAFNSVITPLTVAATHPVPT